MDLILWRHAEAVPEREGLDDLDRPLTPKGERQAQRMAEWLNHRLAHSTRILVSPALRTQQTANRCATNRRACSSGSSSGGSSGSVPVRRHAFTSSSASCRHASTRNAPEPIAGSHTLSSSSCAGVTSGPRRSSTGRSVVATIGSVSERGV